MATQLKTRTSGGRENCCGPGFFVRPRREMNNRRLRFNGARPSCKSFLRGSRHLSANLRSARCDAREHLLQGCIDIYVRHAAPAHFSRSCARSCKNGKNGWHVAGSVSTVKNERKVIGSIQPRFIFVRASRSLIKQASPNCIFYFTTETFFAHLGSR